MIEDIENGLNALMACVSAVTYTYQNKYTCVKLNMFQNHLELPPIPMVMVVGSMKDIHRVRACFYYSLLYASSKLYYLLINKLLF